MITDQLLNLKQDLKQTGEVMFVIIIIIFIVIIFIVVVISV